MTKVQTHETICKELNALYARKNADYGDSFGKSFKEYGLAATCLRLDDKLNRLKALRTAAAQVKDESIEDTLLDLANYAIMTVIEMRGEGDESSPLKGNGKDNLPLKGSHDGGCRVCDPMCPCNTCRRDNTYTAGVNDPTCCVEHKRICSAGEAPCPDYVPDCEEAK